MQCCALRKQQTPATWNGGDRGGVWIPLFSVVTLFEYNVLIALAFAHFSSELSLKEQMFVHVKKTLNNAGHIDTKLIDFSEISTQNPAKSAVFY